MVSSLLYLLILLWGSFRIARCRLYMILCLNIHMYTSRFSKPLATTITR